MEEECEWTTQQNGEDVNTNKTLAGHRQQLPLTPETANNTPKTHKEDSNETAVANSGEPIGQ